jgi:hypothetical protein
MTGHLPSPRIAAHVSIWAFAHRLAIRSEYTVPQGETIMRRSRTAWAFALLSSILCMPGCGKSLGVLVGGGSHAQISLTVHDAAPVGITVLSLQVTVNSATLQPGNVSIALPEKVELTQLQSDTTVLGSQEIASGTYTSLVLDIESPTMTFINNTGGPITPFQGQTCAINAVCQIIPAITNGTTLTFNSAPVFPLVLAANAETGLELDFNIADLVQSDFSLNYFNTGALGVTQLASVQGNAELRRLNHVLGSVTQIQANSFSFTTPTGMIIGVTTDGSTNFNFPSTCLAQNFSCVKAGQVVDVDISLEGSGTLLAKEVDLEADVNVEEISGLVVVLGAPVTNFQMLVRQASPAALTASPTVVGTLVTVAIGGPTTFAVDNHSFTLPAGLAFTNSASLLVGQEVLSNVAITNVPTYTTSSIALRRSQITAIVFAPPAGAGTSFVLSPLPSLFQTALPTNITSLQVDTTAQTTFEDLTPDTLAGVTLGENVSVGGFLFNTQPSPGRFVIAVDAVRGQPIPGP